MQTKNITTKNITTAQIESLRTAAGQGSDCVTAAICDIALGNVFDGDDWMSLSRTEWTMLGLLDQDSAIEMVIQVIEASS